MDGRKCDASVASPLPTSTGFALELGDCINGVYDAIAALGNEPDFEKATDVCLATRVAWSIYYSDWLLAGGCLTHLTERLQAAFAQSRSAVQSAVGKMRTEIDQEYLRLYVNSIGFRMQCVDTLLTRGMEAVTEMLEERAAERQRNPRPVLSR